MSERAWTDDVFPLLVSAVREADQLFESEKTGGGGTRHWLRDCLEPALESRGLQVVAVRESPRPSSIRTMVEGREE